MAKTKLIFLFDGGCPLCQREVSFLRSRDTLNAILFVDIDSPGYKAEAFCGISYRDAMGNIHGLTSSGKVLKGLGVFREAYRLVGLGWVYAPTALPLLAPAFDRLYEFWARRRLFFTRRPTLDKLCKPRQIDSTNEV